MKIEDMFEQFTEDMTVEEKEKFYDLLKFICE